MSPRVTAPRRPPRLTDDDDENAEDDKDDDEEAEEDDEEEEVEEEDEVSPPLHPSQSSHEIHPSSLYRAEGLLGILEGHSPLAR